MADDAQSHWVGCVHSTLDTAMHPLFAFSWPAQTHRRCQGVQGRAERGNGAGRGGMLLLLHSQSCIARLPFCRQHTNTPLSLRILCGFMKSEVEQTDNVSHGAEKSADSMDPIVSRTFSRRLARFASSRTVCSACVFNCCSSSACVRSVAARLPLAKSSVSCSFYRMPSERLYREDVTCTLESPMTESRMPLQMSAHISGTNKAYKG